MSRIYTLKMRHVFLFNFENTGYSEAWLKQINSECFIGFIIRCRQATQATSPCTHQGLYSLKIFRLTWLAIPNINLRRSDIRLKFIMGILIPIRWCLAVNKGAVVTQKSETIRCDLATRCIFEFIQNLVIRCVYLHRVQSMYTSMWFTMTPIP